MITLKKIGARPIVKELRREILRYQEIHSEAYIKASKEDPDDSHDQTDKQFDITMAKLEALYELKGELRAKGYM